METTLCIIKPDAVKNGFENEINQKITASGLEIVKSKKISLSEEIAKNFYNEIEDYLGVKIRYDRNFYRLYKDITDQNDIISKAYSSKYKGYLNIDFEGEAHKKGIQNDIGGVEVLQSGNLDIKVYLDAFQQLLEKEQSFISEKFEYQKLKISEDKVSYKNIE